MTSKYGVACTQDGWRGWPLRVGHFEARGQLQGLVAASDAVLVWSGGRTEVTLHERRARGTARQDVTRHDIVRQGGMIDFLPRGTTFEEITWRGEPSACISVSFDAPQLERLMGSPSAPAGAEVRLALTDAHVVDLVQRLRAQALLGQPWGALYVDALSLALASYVHARYVRSGRALSSKAVPLPLEPLIAYVDEHLDENIGLSDLAAVVGYSPDHFTRRFRQAFGQTPHQYVLERRIERAKSLLRDHTRSIADVAVQCGFASQAHFQTAFKARTGVTPGVYRKG